jgi:hypothetical protein
VAGALVAVVDFLRVCEVQPGYWGEFFCGGGWAGEDGGAGAGSDIEDLGEGDVVSLWVLLNVWMFELSRYDIGIVVVTKCSS